MTASLSSVYGRIFNASYAVDGITECLTGVDRNLACTENQTNPWLKVNRNNTSTVDRVLIYNRQDCCGERLHEVRVDVIDNGRNVSCGFYQGPAANGDRILFLCEMETRGSGVIISILSKDGPTDFLSVCEVEIYGQS
ncbi:fucolectin-like [Saccostrea cucullata]|uniref:fucolectin-like n=1 Tax=Saccostrea cuccullata TaxID=36930 RepID=UPI002ED16608